MENGFGDGFYDGSKEKVRKWWFLVKSFMEKLNVKEVFVSLGTVDCFGMWKLRIYYRVGFFSFGSIDIWG